MKNGDSPDSLRSEFLQIVTRQLDHFYLPLRSDECSVIETAVLGALRRCEYCFSHTPYKGYQIEGRPYLNPYHSGQYAIFLYFLSRELRDRAPESISLADRVYGLNKALNSVELFYEVELPSIFFIDHPVGSVLGRADYEDYFAFHQGCTVGNNRGVYPRIGEHVTMLANSQIIGDCRIGSCVMLSANTCVMDEDIPECSLVFGRSPNLTIKHRPREFFLTPPI
jgi:serine O-acetyltransferase